MINQFPDGSSFPRIKYFTFMKFKGLAHDNYGYILICYILHNQYFQDASFRDSWTLLGSHSSPYITDYGFYSLGSSLSIRSSSRLSAVCLLMDFCVYLSAISTLLCYLFTPWEWYFLCDFFFYTFPSIISSVFLGNGLLFQSSQDC